jgi:hypothetical protein
MLRAIPVEIIHENEARCRRLAGSEHVGHCTRPRRFPDTTKVRKPGGKNHLVSSQNCSAHHVRIQQVTLREGYPVWQVTWPATLRHPNATVFLLPQTLNCSAPNCAEPEHNKIAHGVISHLGNGSSMTIEHASNACFVS